MARFRILTKSKIQRLTVTDKNLRYEGSLAVDAKLLSAADILPAEVVQVVNVNNGNRFETYAIRARPGSGACVLNGGAARMGEVGDELIVMSNVIMDETEAVKHRLTKVVVDKRNRMVNDRSSSSSR